MGSVLLNLRPRFRKPRIKPWASLVFFLLSSTVRATHPHANGCEGIFDEAAQRTNAKLINSLAPSVARHVEAPKDPKGSRNLRLAFEDAILEAVAAHPANPLAQAETLAQRLHQPREVAEIILLFYDFDFHTAAPLERDRIRNQVGHFTPVPVPGRSHPIDDTWTQGLYQQSRAFALFHQGMQGRATRAGTGVGPDLAWWRDIYADIARMEREHARNGHPPKNIDEWIALHEGRLWSLFGSFVEKELLESAYTLKPGSFLIPGPAIRV